MPAWAAREAVEGRQVAAKLAAPLGTTTGVLRGTSKTPTPDNTWIQGGGQKPKPGYKILNRMVFSWETAKRLPEKEVVGWQTAAAARVAAMAPADLGSSHGASAEQHLKLGDRIQMGCYGPRQRVGQGGYPQQTFDRR